MTAKLIQLPQSSLADIPTQLRKLADAYEASPEARVNIVLVVREDEGPVCVYALGARTDAGLQLAMLTRARSVLVAQALDEEQQS